MGREHACALPVLRSAELGADRCCGPGQLNTGCRHFLLLNLPIFLMVALLLKTPQSAALHVVLAQDLAPAGYKTFAGPSPCVPVRGVLSRVQSVVCSRLRKMTKALGQISICSTSVCLLEDACQVLHKPPCLCPCRRGGC